jgi:hypothetical protein
MHHFIAVCGVNSFHFTFETRQPNLDFFKASSAVSKTIIIVIVIDIESQKGTQKPARPTPLAAFFQLLATLIEVNCLYSLL